MTKHCPRARQNGEIATARCAALAMTGGVFPCSPRPAPCQLETGEARDASAERHPHSGAGVFPNSEFRIPKWIARLTKPSDDKPGLRGARVRPPSHEGSFSCILQAGLLARGSSYLRRLPTRSPGQWLCTAFVAAHSGGAAADFHGLPFSPRSGHPGWAKG